MRTSHKLTRLILALMTLVVMSTMALAQAPTNVQVSDQKVGSVLVYPYYISNTGNVKSNTRISMTNVNNAVAGPATLQRVHVFLLSGRDCTQADLFVCLTPNATATFQTSDYDPDNTGYIIAVAVDATGVPQPANNVLIGNAFVSENTNSATGTYEGNYGAESFWGTAGTVTVNADQTANINWGGRWDQVPTSFAVEIQSPADSTGQRIVLAGLLGDVSAGALSGCAQAGTGQAFNEMERFGSFQGFITGTCLCRATLTASAPRVPGGLLALIPTGKAGSLKFNVAGAVGLLMTPRNNTNVWSGIRTLHKFTTAASDGRAGGSSTTKAHLTIPIFTPVC